MTDQALLFRALSGSGMETRPITLESAVIALWTGRDAGAQARRIAEMAALGVTAPAVTPTFVRISPRRLTTADRIEVLGTESSGEVEVLLVRDARGLWVGVGSDHTDRRVERYDVAVSKQMCDKPVAPDLWAFDDVADHWDSLVLRSWIGQDGEMRLYQENTVDAILPPDAIIAGCCGQRELPEGTAILCGTLSTQSGIRPAHRFAFELYDPLRERRIAHAYDIRSLPVTA